MVSKVTQRLAKWVTDRIVYLIYNVFYAFSKTGKNDLQNKVETKFLKYIY